MVEVRFSHRGIDFLLLKNFFRLVERQRRNPQPNGFIFYFSAPERNEIFVLQKGDFSSKSGRRILFFGRSLFDRNDYIAFNLEKAAGNFPGYCFPPLLLEAKIAPVCDDLGCILSQFNEAGNLPIFFVRKDEPDPSLLQRFADLKDSLQHESKMPFVGLGKIFHDFKKNKERDMLGIRHLYGQLQGVVAMSALGGLHPVDDVLALADLLVVEAFLPRKLNQVPSSAQPAPDPETGDRDNCGKKHSPDDIDEHDGKRPVLERCQIGQVISCIGE
jgi:hypothetical protein